MSRATPAVSFRVRASSLLAVSCAAIAAPAAHAQWTFVSLHPAGASESMASGVDASQQAGFARFSGQAQAVVWSGSAASCQSLHPPGTTWSEILGTHPGQQMGNVFSGGYRASVWNGTNSWTNLHPNGASQSFGFSVHAGQQVGFATFGVDRASLWSGTSASRIDLHPPTATGNSTATDTYNGQQCGYARVGSGFHAGVWYGSSASWVDMHPPAAFDSFAFGVDAGRQVGYCVVPGRSQTASLWASTASSWIDLNPPGATQSGAQALHTGIQVGYAVMGGITGACYWTGTPTSYEDLHHYAPPQFSQTQARGVWNDGTTTFIVGAGFNASANRWEAMMWTRPTPCDADINCDFALDGFDVEVQERAVGGDLTDYCQPDADFNHDFALDGFDVEAVEIVVGGGPCP